LPSGGTSGQVLKKLTNYLYDAYWADADASDVDQDTIAKAWVNFKGTATVTIRDSYNVSSITDEGVGLYQVNFSSSIGHSNYSAVVGGFYNTTGGTGGGGVRLRRSAFNASYVKIESLNIATGSSRADSNTVTCIVFG